ncbi:MAG: hypothetical protein GX424_05420 [Clostridiales bacterium]|nr:hypothetical protein [Clostridiales bacterium]
MTDNLIHWETACFVFTVILGSFLHFTYRWSGNNPAVGIISPVNESPWEHLKLLFVPTVFFSALEYFAVGKEFPDFIAAKAWGMLFGMLLILVIFYTYTGMIGEHYLWADILTFLIGAAAACFYPVRLIPKLRFCGNMNWAGLAGLAAVFLCFAVFTFSPPQIPLFWDPVAKNYGARKK